MPKASVIILNWNGWKHLEICLPALAVQTCRDFDVIVVDNASTADDSVARLRLEFPWVMVVPLGENRGFSGGNLAGVELAKGEYVILLNNDTRPATDWLERLVASADAHPEAGIVAAHLTDWDGGMTDSAGDGCRVTGRGFARHRGLAVDAAPASGPCFGACAGAALYRRELIKEIGFLDPDFFLNFEDTDLSLRARLAGWGVWFSRESRVCHRGSASQGSWSKWNVYYGARNHVWVCAKNLPLWLLIKYSPINLAEMIAMGLRSIWHGRGGDYLRGVVAGFRGIGRQLPKRRVILSKAKLTTRDLERELERDYLRRLGRRLKGGRG